MKRKGFTLIELLIVIVIIGILAAIALPSLLQNRNTADATRITSNANAISKDFLNFVVAEIPAEVADAAGVKTSANKVYKSSWEWMFRNETSSDIETGAIDADSLKNMLINDYWINKSYANNHFNYLAADSLANLNLTADMMKPDSVILASYTSAAGADKSFLIYCGKKGLQSHGNLKNTVTGESKNLFDKIVAETTHKGSCYPVDLSV